MANLKVGYQVWIVIDDNGEVKGVWNSGYHTEQQTNRLGLDIKKNIKISQYLGGV